MSRTTYYGLVRDSLMNEHSKMFSLLLILALLAMTGLAAFLTSDILSIASDSSYKGALANYLGEPKKGLSDLSAIDSSGSNKGPSSSGDSKMTGDNITGKLNASNQSGIKDSSNSSRIEKATSSKSNQLIVGGGSSSGSSSKSTSSKKSSSGSKSNRSSSKGSSSSKSAKAENNSQNNSTQSKTAQMNQTLMNQSSINQSQSSKSAAKELNVKNLSSLLPAAINVDQEKTNDTSLGKPVVRMEFKTDSTMKSTSENDLFSEKTVNWPASNSISLFDSGDSQGNQKANKKEITRNTITSKSRDATAKSKLTARKSQVKPAQSKRVTAPAKSTKRLQSTRDQQKANRSKALESRKKQAANSRARPTSR